MLVALQARCFAVSIDTRFARVVVNDVSGLRYPAMCAVAARHGVPAVAMHMPIDDPTLMMQHTDYVDVVDDVVAFLRDHAALALAEGVPFGSTSRRQPPMSDNLANFGKGYLFGSIIFSLPVRFLFRWICWLIAVPAGVGNLMDGKYMVGVIVLAIVGFWMWRRREWHLAMDDYDDQDDFDDSGR